MTKAIQMGRSNADAYSNEDSLGSDLASTTRPLPTLIKPYRRREAPSSLA